MNVLLSTSTAWNCGDDWIREGLLNVLDLHDSVGQIWHNRGWGVAETFANSPHINLPLADYIIMAGTPEWVARNEVLLRHALRYDKPIAFLGVGRTGGYLRSQHEDLMRRVADSGLVEISIARDDIAKELLEGNFGIETSVLCDPAIFLTPVGKGGKTFVLGYRGWGSMEEGGTCTYRPRQTGPAARTDNFFRDAWAGAKGPKIATVHDNREAEAAIGFYGKRKVRYFSDPARMLKVYGDARDYVGSRIHGFVGAVVHGASAHLIYHTDKAACAKIIIERLGLEGSAAVTFLQGEKQALPALNLEAPGIDRVQARIGEEAAEFRGLCLSAPKLSELMKR